MTDALAPTDAKLAADLAKLASIPDAAILAELHRLIAGHIAQVFQVPLFVAESRLPPAAMKEVAPR